MACWSSDSLLPANLSNMFDNRFQCGEGFSLLRSATRLYIHDPYLQCSAMAEPKITIKSGEVGRFPDHGSFVTFLEENLLPNRPCIFEQSFTSSWRARQEWRNDDDSPNLLYLEENFGNAVVPVADCSRVEYSTHPKTEMTLREYVHYWRSKVTRGEESTSDLKYLKDWHFVQAYPDYGAYTVPICFTSDWLNEVWSTRVDTTDDYRFVYMGPKGTWTPFHADVFRSYSWSANVCGCKEWLFFPPGEEEHLRDKFGHLPFSVTNKDMDDSEMYPHLHKSAGPIRVVQRSGEIIFVPSGWHHQVKNIEDTISINHNWTNSCGIGYMWTHLQSELTLVKRELEDCQSMEGWEEQCQVVLRASAGIDYWEFVQLLSLIAMARLGHLSEILPPSSKLCIHFDSLRTLIQETLSNSPKSVTFLQSAVEFQAIRYERGMEKVFTNKLFGEDLNAETHKLVNLISKPLQELFYTHRDSVAKGGKTLMVLFLMYELSAVSSVLANTVACISKESFAHKRD